MGFLSSDVRMLLVDHTAGVDFTRAATLGRHRLACTKQEMVDALMTYGYQADGDWIDALDGTTPQYQEPFLKLLGTKEITCIDYSDFEGADTVFDMNNPIHEDLKRRFSAVLDGGTLEHIFNFPTAIRNAMEMVEPGGHFLGFHPIDGYCGHGFYQFSPELLFQVFCPANGFEVRKILVYEQVSNAKWYLVSNPAELRTRINLKNKGRLMAHLVAQRVDLKPIFDSYPQQSDYVARWAGETPPAPPSYAPSPQALTTTRGRWSTLARRNAKRVARHVLPYSIYNLVAKRYPLDANSGNAVDPDFRAPYFVPDPAQK